MGNSSSQLDTIQLQLDSMKKELDQQETLKKELGELNNNYNLDIQWLNYYRAEMESFQQQLRECSDTSQQKLAELQSRLDEMENKYKQCKASTSPKNETISMESKRPTSFLEQIRNPSLRRAEPKESNEPKGQMSILDEIKNRPALRPTTVQPPVPLSKNPLLEKLKSRRNAINPKDEEESSEWGFRPRKSPKKLRKSPKKLRKSPKKSRKTPNRR